MPTGAQSRRDSGPRCRNAKGVRIPCPCYPGQLPPPPPPPLACPTCSPAATPPAVRLTFASLTYASNSTFGGTGAFYGFATVRGTLGEFCLNQVDSCKFAWQGTSGVYVDIYTDIYGGAGSRTLVETHEINYIGLDISTGTVYAISKIFDGPYIAFYVTGATISCTASTVVSNALAAIGTTEAMGRTTISASGHVTVEPLATAVKSIGSICRDCCRTYTFTPDVTGSADIDGKEITFTRVANTYTNACNWRGTSADGTVLGVMGGNLGGGGFSYGKWYMTVWAVAHPEKSVRYVGGNNYFGITRTSGFDCPPSPFSGQHSDYLDPGSLLGFVVLTDLVNGDCSDADPVLANGCTPLATCYEVTGIVTGAAVQYFNGGASFPAGSYRITYKRGSLVYQVGLGHSINLFGVGGDGFYVYGQHDDGTGTIAEISFSEAPGDSITTYPDQAAVETANAGASVVVTTEADGPIGIGMLDAPYTDNVADSTAPVFELCPV